MFFLNIMKRLIYRSKPAIRLLLTSKRHISKFGGYPNLPDSLEWPKNPEGFDLDFLAQIHCPELPEGFGIPSNGTFFVFYDVEENPWGYDEKDRQYWKLIYSDAPLPEAVRTPQATRAESFEFPEAFLKFKVFRSRVTDEEKYKDSPGHHQMFGYPLTIQTSDLEQTELLLLQIDTDEKENGPCWMWGDYGRLYFRISPEDLAARRFDRVTMTLEGC